MFIKSYNNLFLTLFILLITTGCTDNSTHGIEATEQIIEQNPAGKWIASFSVNYNQSPRDTKKQIVEKLHKHGKLIDKYRHEDNGNIITTFIWNYEGNTIKKEYYRGGIWRGPKITPRHEYYHGEIPVWVTIVFKNGIPYSEVLPNHYKKINKNSEYEHRATIRFPKDNARLFLFGNGTLCNRISLF